MTALSVIIPVFRAGETLRELHRQLTAELSLLAKAYEIIFVEDGGGDNSWSVICDLARDDHHVRGLRMSRNFGQHNAVLCGIRAAKHEIIVTMDDDLQNPVGEIATLLGALKDDIDVVYGYPSVGQHGLLRNLASRFTKLALKRAMGAETAQHVSAFRAFRTWLRVGFEGFRSPTVSVDVLLTWATSRFTSVKVRHEARTTGVSGYTLGKLVRHAVNLMTGFSTLPLQVASLVGLAFVAFGACILVFVLGNYLIRGSGVPGFTFLATISTIFSGAQLFALGIFGEYLARMHFRSMDRPPYVVGGSTDLVDASGKSSQ
jgi:undecaprenyl-phosphate 4-deoxy-4-formamido-L-arabinose transferase